MNTATESYLSWYCKTIKNLGYTKGFAAKCLLRRFEALKTPATDLEAIQHARQLYYLFEDFSKDKPGIRWLCKLCENLQVWQNTLEAVCQHSNDIAEDDVIQSLLKSHSSVDEAISLVQIAKN